MRRNARHGARKWGEEECCPSTPVVPRVQHGPETELSRFHVFIGARGSRGVQHHHHTARETGTKSTKIRKPLYLSYLSRLKINSVNTRGEQQAQLRCSQPHRLWLGSESCRGGAGLSSERPPCSVRPSLHIDSCDFSFPSSFRPRERSTDAKESPESSVLRERSSAPHRAQGAAVHPSPPPPPIYPFGDNQSAPTPPHNVGFSSLTPRKR